MIIIVGGGLSGCLLAYKLSLMETPPNFLLIEANRSLGGNHTWSFHESDISANSLQWLRPLIHQSWTHQEVKFSDYQRVFKTGYHSINSASLAKVVKNVIGNRLILGRRIDAIRSNGITFEDGEEIEAQIVFDARGMSSGSFKPCGYQKFVGMDLELEEPHCLKHPVIMDASCEQKDGYRFFYLLPWSPTTLLIEDTRYSNDPGIVSAEYEREIENYCKKENWRIKKVLRTESAALPIPLESKEVEESEYGISIGIKGGYFNSTTGYSLPSAVQMAEVISSEFERNSNVEIQSLLNKLKPLKLKARRQVKFFTMLNRMLFLAAKPKDRWKIFYRFYKFREGLIFRFYRGDLRKRDQIRILVGRPPVPIMEGLRFGFKLSRLW